MTETSESFSVEKTAKEHVASNAIPRIIDGGVLLSERARFTAEQMQRQMSVVDCSCHAKKDQYIEQFKSLGRWRFT